VISHEKAGADPRKAAQRPGNILDRDSLFRIGGQLYHAQVQALDDLERSEIRRRLHQDNVSGIATCSKSEVDGFGCADCYHEIVRCKKAPAFGSASRQLLTELSGPSRLSLADNFDRETSRYAGDSLDQLARRKNVRTW
jgi:hypothetical protein